MSFWLVKKQNKLHGRTVRATRYLMNSNKVLNEFSNASKPYQARAGSECIYSALN